jgi:hypothetical protein
MADAIYLPGTEMEIFEKYPLSRRLDHPTFSDVKKTTYAKGVITEFQKVSDDPLVVESMVKVEIDGEESEFIPLFYQPKEKYWDTEDAEAREFDGEKGCYKQAWMSFHSGDEVEVMIKEGVPVAVVGFADGKPLVGENVFKMEWSKWNGEKHFAHILAVAAPGTSYRVGSWLISDVPSNEWSEYGRIDSDPKGPDGKPLGLTVEAEKICETPWETVEYPGEPDIKGGYIDHTMYMEYLIRLGGKLYIMQIADRWQWFNEYYESFGPGVWVEEYTSYSPFNFSILGAPDSRELYESTKKLGAKHSNYSPTAIWNGDYSVPPDRNEYIAYPGFTFQPGCIDGIMWYHNTIHRELFPTATYGDDIVKCSTMRIYVRPHKEEGE